MTPAGFEPTIPASDRPQTHALDRAATGMGQLLIFKTSNFFLHVVLSDNTTTKEPRWLYEVLVEFGCMVTMFYKISGLLLQ